MNTKANTVNLEDGEATAVDAVKASYDQNLPLIIAATEDGTMARLVMKYRPLAKIACASPNPTTLN